MSRVRHAGLSQTTYLALKVDGGGADEVALVVGLLHGTRGRLGVHHGCGGWEGVAAVRERKQGRPVPSVQFMERCE